MFSIPFFFSTKEEEGLFKRVENHVLAIFKHINMRCAQQDEGIFRNRSKRLYYLVFSELEDGTSMEKLELNLLDLCSTLLQS